MSRQRTPGEPGLVRGSTGAAAFLDGAGIPADRLVEHLAAAFLELPADAVLTVHADAPDAQDALPEWCRRTGHALLAVIRHDDGTKSFTMLGRETPVLAGEGAAPVVHDARRADGS